MLNNDRQNLNASWLARASETGNTAPDLAYMSTTRNAKGQLTTADGWPSEGLVVFSHRLIVGFDMDPELDEYNTTQDRTLYHGYNDLVQREQVTYNPNGTIANGCFIPTPESLPSQLESSWAVTTNLNLPAISQSSISNLPSISNLTSCAISPLIAQPVSNTSASSAPLPYLSIPSSSLWSWAPNEPHNISSSDPNNSRIRCALLDLSLGGHWRIADCAEQHRGACRVGDSAYGWKLSLSKGAYSSMQDNCPSNSTFSVPRTGAENAALYRALLNAPPSAETGPAIWVDWNSLSVATCWVRGLKTACPYGGTTKADGARKVVVPIVAAVIVLVVAALLLLVKCAANRRNIRRRRRRARDETEYEGVPS